MIPRFRPALGWQELVAAIIPSSRDDVSCFERAFAEKMGQRHAIAFPYGRTGLVLLLKALDIEDKEIICPAYTCVVVPHAIVYSGNTPVFVDSRAEDFNMDLDLVQEAITENTGAIIATSIFGYPVDLGKLDKIRKKYPHIHIIQDCAHSFAAEWQGRSVHKEGIAAIFGLNISKLITSVFGGMVTTDDDRLAEKLKQVRGESLAPPSFSKSCRRLFYLLAVYPAFWPPIYGLINRLERSGLLDRFAKYYDESKIDMPADYLQAMTDLEARVGIEQLKKYDDIVATRRKVALFYNQHLQNIPELKLPPLIEGATYSHYVPLVKDREAVLAKALDKGIQLGWLIEYCIPEMKAYERCKFLKRKSIAENVCQKTINLPVWSKYRKNNEIIKLLLKLWGFDYNRSNKLNFRSSQK